MSWYYEKNNEQNGPVSEDELMQLHRDAAINANNLVWREGMSDWATLGDTFPGLGASSGGEVACPTCGQSVAAELLIPAGDSQVCPSCKDEFAQGLREGLSQPVRRGGSLGTGGQTPNGELRALARNTLAGAWGMAVLVTFLYSLIQQMVGVVPIIGPIVQWVIAGPMALGFVAYFMGLHREEPVEVGTMFNGFSRFGQGLGIYFVTTVIVSLAALAAAIPGAVMIFVAFEQSAVPEESPLFIAGIFVAALPAVVVGVYMYLRYALVYYIANDHPDLGIFGTIKRSTEMMVGRKGKLFMLSLSFLGWHFLGLLAFVVGLLWSMTYMWAAYAAFYDDIGEDA